MLPLIAPDRLHALRPSYTTGRRTIDYLALPHSARQPYLEL